MKRNEIIQEVKKYFHIQELVCPHIFKVHGDKSWKFLDTSILHVLLVLITEILKVPMVINDYHNKGTITQRGLRCNLCPLVKNKTTQGLLYLTAHRGMAFDIVFTKASSMTADRARSLIKENKDKLPCNVRLEKDVTWLHIDTYDEGIKVYEFKI